MRLAEESDEKKYIKGLLEVSEKVQLPAEKTETELKGDETIIICGEIAAGAIGYFAKFRREELIQHFPKWLADEAMKVAEGALLYPDFEKIHSAKAIIPVAEGGMYKAIFDIWSKYQKGFEIDYSAVPVSQISVEICEMYDLDPWRVFSGGCCLMIADNAKRVKSELEAQGFTAKTVGYVRDDKDKLICHRETVSRADRPKRDELLGVL